MRTIAAAAIGAALLGMVSAACAQNAPTTQVSPSPASINKSSRATMPSGAESRAAATNGHRRVAGRSKYCKQTGRRLDCFYASMKTCQKRAKSTNLHCVVNPNRA